ASFRTSSGEHPESIISALFGFGISPQCYQARSVDSESRSFLTVQNDEYRFFPEARMPSASLKEYGHLHVIPASRSETRNLLAAGT
ncbi:hypothetical protein, partial [Vibrio alfacsensis]|uniref:hypothetical protein n=1 Tax=Vibrio alfacsensis TaxID=1074311 RepID=UPI0040679CF3